MSGRTRNGRPDAPAPKGASLLAETAPARAPESSPPPVEAPAAPHPAESERDALRAERAALAAEVERLKAALASAESAALSAMAVTDDASAEVRVPYALQGIRHGGVDYDPPARLPFDPRGVAVLVEGVHYEYRAPR